MVAVCTNVQSEEIPHASDYLARVDKVCSSSMGGNCSPGRGADDTKSESGESKSETIMKLGTAEPVYVSPRNMLSTETAMYLSPSTPPLFYVDTMLAPLARWLRVLGLDAELSSHDITHSQLLSHVAQENKGRLILTRNKKLVARKEATLRW
jgi:hypothetical protein